MRILQVVSSAARSGGEGHVRTLALALRDRGHEVTVVLPRSQWMARDLDGIAAHEADFRSRLGLEAHQTLARLLSASRYDVVHAHLSRAGYVSLLAGWRAKVPVLLSVHTETREPLYRLAARGSNRLIAVSGFIRDVLCAQGIPESKVSVVPHGTPLGAPPLLPVPSDVPRDKAVLTVVGRLAPEKGQHIAVQAMPGVLSRHPNAHLLCVGRDVDGFRALLENEAQRLGVADSVSFLDHSDDVAAVFDASIVALLPSVIESFGLVVLEAMARARPVIVSPAGALAELVEHGSTGLVVPNDVPRWAEAIVSILDDPRAARAMGERARDRVLAGYTVDAMAEKAEMAYSEAMAGAR